MVNTKIKPLNLPKNTDLAFFDYGIFKPGEIAHSLIEKYIEGEAEPLIINYKMFLRDGVPFIANEYKKYSKTYGYLMKFGDTAAYDIICRTLSQTLYYWAEIDIEGISVNVLIGKKPSRSNPLTIQNFTGREDPLFSEALEVIYDDLNQFKPSHNIRDFFKIQRNYILLWAAIERYTLLRYGMNSKSKNNKRLAGEEIFKKSLSKRVSEKRVIYRTDTLDKCTLSSQNPEDSIDYYYTIRCNIVHRGKTVYDDIDVVLKSLSELLDIFQDVLDDTFKCD